MNSTIEACGLQLLFLPEEVQVEILMYLDYHSLLRCTLVSRLTMPQPIVDSHILDVRSASPFIM